MDKKMNFIDTLNLDVQKDIELCVFNALRQIPHLLEKYNSADLDTEEAEYYLNYQMLTQLFMTKYLGYSMQTIHQAMTMSDEQKEKWRKFANNIKLGHSGRGGKENK